MRNLLRYQKSSASKQRRPTAFLWLCLLLAGSGQDLSAQGQDLELLSKPPYPIEVQWRVDRITPNDDNPNLMETEEDVFRLLSTKTKYRQLSKSCAILGTQTFGYFVINIERTETTRFPLENMTLTLSGRIITSTRKRLTVNRSELLIQYLVNYPLPLRR